MKFFPGTGALTLTLPFYVTSTWNKYHIVPQWSRNT